MKQGTLITLEGGDGAGKSSIIRMVQEWLAGLEMEALFTREPGGVEIAEKIRALILDRNHTAMDKRTEALLYAAARRQHLVEVVLPAMQAGKLVICDRFVDSSLAYQGYARGIGADEVWMINRFAIEDCMPDLTLYFDVRPEIGMARIEANAAREQNRLDVEHLDFHQRVRDGYLQLAETFSDRIRVIDGEQSLDAVFAEVKKQLAPYLGVSSQ